MCDRQVARRLLAGPLLLVASIATAQAPGTRPGPYDALREYWTVRSARADSQLQLQRRTIELIGLDTSRGGGIVFLAPSELSSVALATARQSDSLVASYWLPARERSIPTFDIRPLPRVAPDGAPDDTGTPPARLLLALRNADGTRSELLRFDAASDGREPASMAVRRAVVEPRLQALAPELRTWMVHTPDPRRPTAVDWRDTWWQLAAFPSLPARGCLGGEPHQCEIALALTVEPDPVLNWYDAPLRQALAARWLESYRSDQLSPLREIALSCAERGDPTACARFLRDRELGASMVEPGPVQMRTLIVRYAFSLPADSAARNRAATATGLSIRERLSLASGLPFDTLLQRFQSQLEQRRPSPLRPSATLLWATTGWFLVLAGLSLRSTRWR